MFMFMIYVTFKTGTAASKMDYMHYIYYDTSTVLHMCNISTLHQLSLNDKINANVSFMTMTEYNKLWTPLWVQKPICTT